MINLRTENFFLTVFPIVILLCGLPACADTVTESDIFPVYDSLRPNVSFWGKIYTQYSTSSWQNLTITDNSAKFGGGVYCNSFSNPKISNSILWNNSPQEVCFHKFGDIKMTLSYSNIMNAEDGFKTNNNGSLFF